MITHTTVVQAPLPGEPSSSHSIPHNRHIRQAELSTHLKPESRGNLFRIFRAGNHDSETPTQTAARRLYDLGLNVFPQPIGKKGGYPWKKLQYLRLHPTHDGYGVSVVFAGRCNIAVMCGRTSQNLFVIDHETRDSFQASLAAMRTRHIPIWTVETARGGHIYLFSADGEVDNIDTGCIPDTEIKGHCRYVLAPPSVHPSGAIYTWCLQEGPLPPTVALSQINWLTDTSGTPVHLKPVRQQASIQNAPPPPLRLQDRPITARSRLSRATQEYIQSGHLLPEGTRNKRLFSAACDLHGNGWSLEQSSTILTQPAQSSGLDPTEIERTIRSAFSQTREPAKPQPARTKNEDWKAALIFAGNHDWKGRSAASDRTIFLTLIHRAQINTNENGVFRASIREIAATARIGTATVQRSLRRLQSSSPPLLFRVGQDTISDASLWRFSNYVLQFMEQLKMDTLTPAPPWLSVSVSIFNADLDVLERGALGKNGYLVYRLMLVLSGPVLPSVLSDYAKLKVHTINYALAKLRRFGLIRRQPQGWVAIPATAEELEARVSGPSGTLGKGAARRRRYAAERQIHAGRLIMRARLKREGQPLVDALTRHESALLIAFERHQAALEQTCPAMVQSEVPVSSRTKAVMKIWKCPNCGQYHFSDSPPDMCDFCHDFTTWRLCSVIYPDEDTAEQRAARVDPIENDALLQLAIELGAVIVEEEESAGDESGAESPGGAPPPGT